MMVRAFQRDFEVNGPSIARIVRTTLAGWKRYKNHPDPRIRRRFTWESKGLATTFPAVVWAMKRYYRKDPAMRAKMDGILQDLYAEFGWTSRLVAALAGPYVLWKIRGEEKRLAKGWTYEPPTFYERNDFVEPPATKDLPRAEPCSYVTPRAVPEQPVKETAVEPAPVLSNAR
ncbi:MAG: hypothetical protein HQ582_01450 [Planctomycetes bacterium]|nr:hypothetical protein [Planctomycetota bacterium]